MYETAILTMWKYLHDDKSVVSEHLFVTDPYSYTSRFVDVMVRNPEVMSMLKSKIREEKMNSSVVGLFLRGGYGMTELRILKMMQIEAFREILMREFMELIEEQNGPRLRRK